MSLKTLVKVSAVNNLSDARYCAGMGVGLLGFPVDSAAAGCLTPEQFKALTQWVAGVRLVGELGAPDWAAIQHTLAHYTLDYLQLRYPVSLGYLADIDLPLLLQVQLQGCETLASLSACLAPYEPYVKYFLLEAVPSAGHLQPMVHQLATRFPILQGFQVVPEQVPQLLHAPLKGLALRGGEELKPGYKDYDGLAAVLERLVVE